MNLITLYFAGSGQGLSSEDNTIVDAYRKTNGCAMFLPGPGGKDPNVYQKNFPIIGGNSSQSDVGQNTKSTGAFTGKASKRKLTGKGWNRNVFFALEAIADYLDRIGGPVTINIAGHSRGSITVIMLLNDILHEHPSSEYTIASTIKGVKTYKKNDKRDFNEWYESRLKKIWSSRMSDSGDAEYGIECLKVVMGSKNRLAINVFLFDPVGGLNQGCSSRKQDFPNHNCVKRARVLRMETGGAGGTLSSNMPKFEGWHFLTGEHPEDLGRHSQTERYLIPLPGSHGSGLDSNKGKTVCQRYIGTSYMLGLLRASGTEYEAGYTETFGQLDKLYDAYNQLYKENLHIAPGSQDMGKGVTNRRNIHTHHTIDKKGSGTYKGDAINGHHKFLKTLNENRRRDVSYDFGDGMSINPLFGGLGL